jgi:hypothetical protein
MKTLIKIFFLFHFIISDCYSQNLVPNWSFEDTTTYGCPVNLGDIDNSCIGWSSAKGSPDYFNTCNQDSVSISRLSVPSNFIGVQNASTGNAYAGFLTYIGTPNIYEREWIKSKLDTPLTIGTKYYISFKVSLADSVNCATNNIGVLFTTISMYYQINAPLNNFTHFNYNTVITDTSGWTTISGIFIADSSYQYVMIGNFYDYSLTDSIYYPNRPVSYWLDSSRCFAYYYIDDIEICDSSLCNPLMIEDNEILKNTIYIYPNPTKNNITVNNPERKNIKIKIYNLLGALLSEYELQNSATIKLNNLILPQGIYIVNILYECPLAYLKFIFVAYTSN